MLSLSISLSGTLIPSSHLPVPSRHTGLVAAELGSTDLEDKKLDLNSSWNLRVLRLFILFWTIRKKSWANGC